MTQNLNEMKTLPGHDMAGSLQEGQDSKLDLPFDLNNLFSLQYSFDTLKVAIEYLARQQKESQNNIANMMENMLTKDDESRLGNKKGSIIRGSIEHAASGGRGSGMNSSIKKQTITAPVSEGGDFDVSAMGASNIMDVPEVPLMHLTPEPAELDRKLMEGTERVNTGLGGQRPVSKGDTEYYKDLLDRVENLEQ